MTPNAPGPYRQDELGSAGTDRSRPLSQRAVGFARPAAKPDGHTQVAPRYSERTTSWAARRRRLVHRLRSPLVTSACANGETLTLQATP